MVMHQYETSTGSDMRMEGTYPEPIGSEVEATDGWSGSDASHQRAVDDQKTGRAQQRRMQAIRYLTLAGEHGLTWQELGDRLLMHHGQSSSVLSTLHKEKRIARLQEKRNRCHVYVLPGYVNGRETREAGRTAANRASLALDAAELERFLSAASAEGYDRGWQWGYDQAKAEHEAEPSVEEKFQEAFNRGLETGRRDEALRMLKLVTAMRGSLTRAQGTRVHSHNGVCWMDNPACALDSVEKGIARTVVTTPRPREAME